MLSPKQHRLAEQVQRAQTVLATDLDGTFLGGREAERRALYSYLTDQTHTALIFVTGRDKSHIKHLIEDEGVPRPQFVIGDVGTSVLDGDDLLPVDPIEAWIDSHWPGDENARAALKEHEHHLTLQDVYGGRRRSYFISDRAKAYEAKAAVEKAGYDGIVSDDRFFDVLPRGIQKGPTLLKLIEMLNLEARKVIAAGDTLNDLSLFRTGLPSVAVGNRETELEAALPDGAHVFRADGHGAAGILEALHHFKMYVKPEPVL
ncbi:MAG: HAD family hydrolase [Pseudomonadota bacterium]